MAGQLVVTLLHSDTRKKTACSIFRVFPDTKFFQLVEIHLEDGSFFGDTREGTMHSHCSGQSRDRALQVGKIVIWRCSWNGRPLSGDTLWRNLMVVIVDSWQRPFHVGRAVLWKWSWNGRTLSHYIGRDSAQSILIHIMVLKCMSLYAICKVPLLQEWNLIIGIGIVF